MATFTFIDWPWRYWQRQKPDQIALHLDHYTLTWRQLCQQIDQLAATLQQSVPQLLLPSSQQSLQQSLQQASQRQSNGKRPGCQRLPDNPPQYTVALRGKNSWQFLLTMLALWQNGARVLPLNPQLPQSLLQQLQDDLPIDYGIDLSGERRIASLPLCNVPKLKDYKQDECQSSPHHDLLQKQQVIHWQPERLLTLILTSGSTGLPKAAAHSAAAHLASAAGVLALLPFTASDCWLLSLPLFHVSGQGIVWRWLLAGGQLALRPEQPLIQALAGCSHASLVPTQLWRLLRQYDLPGDLLSGQSHSSASHPPSQRHNSATSPDLSHLRAVLLGGASIPTELVKVAQQCGIACWCGYGLTEFASTVCGKRADGQSDVGRVLNSCQLRVVDQEIWLRGDSLAAGYWRYGRLQPLLNPQGWFATRDRGRIAAGIVSIEGRLDNQFFSGGEGIQPEHIEQLLASHPAVRQLFIVPLADNEYGHIPVAVVDSPLSDFSELAAWAKSQLTSYQQPRYWLPLPADMQNGGIKISRHQLRQWVATQCRPSS